MEFEGERAETGFAFPQNSEMFSECFFFEILKSENVIFIIDK